jgi:hypothetical protein
MRAPAYNGAATLTLGALWLLMGAAVPAPADAFVPSVTYVSSTSPSNSNTTKLVHAPCGPGEWVLGGTASIKGGDGQVTIQAAFPTYDAGLGVAIFVVKATEDPTGTVDIWSITAGAYCTSDTVPIYDEASSAFDSSPIKSATIACPADTKVVGMGGEVSITTNGEVAALVATIPDALVVFQGFEVNDDMTQVTARATELAAGLGGVAPQAWKVTAVVACSPPYRFPGLEVMKNKEAGGGALLFQTDSSADIACSAKAKRIIGAASGVHDDGMGQWYLNRMSRRNAFQNTIVAAATRNAELGNAPVTQTAYVVCID